jgi:hypothetical protein
MTTADIGRMVEIRPAYQMDTDARTGWDEIAGCCGWIVRIEPNGEVVVQIKNGDECHVHPARLKMIGGE